MLDVAAAQSAEFESGLQKVFEWHFEQTMTPVRLLFATAGSIVIALLAALLREDASLKTWHIVVILRDQPRSSED